MEEPLEIETIVVVDDETPPEVLAPLTTEEAGRRLLEALSPEEQLRSRLIDALGDDSEIPDAPTRFVVDDDGKADWCLRKMAQLERAKARVTGLYEEEVAALDEWHDKETKTFDDAISFFAGHVERYHRDQYRGDRSRKTLKLPGGRSESTKPALKLEVIDEAAALAWFDDQFGKEAAEKRGLVKVKRDVSVSVTKSLAAEPVLDEDDTVEDTGSVVIDPEKMEVDVAGEVIPGLRWSRSPRKFVPKPGTGR